MSNKKKRQQETAREPEPLGDNWTNPFAGLNIHIEEEPPPPPPPPPPPSRAELAKESLSKEDLALLKAFGGDDDHAPELRRADGKKHIERISLSRERKGRGGKTVTLVRGLENMDTMRQMELCSTIKAELGIGGSFADGILELQGEQLDRAADWFEKHDFIVKGRG